MNMRRDYTNRKPFRRKAEKALAAKTCWKTEDGHYQSDVPVSYHPAVK